MNEKNLPFFSFDLADKNYNERILPFLGKVDSGNLYQWYFYNLLRISSWIVLIGGIVGCCKDIFGEAGYIKSSITAEGLNMGNKIGASVGLLLGLVISIITCWALYSIMKKRIEQIHDAEYNGLLGYLFGNLTPKLITLMGELTFGITLYIGVLQVIASLIGSSVYAPLSEFGTMCCSASCMDGITCMLPKQIHGDYNTFVSDISSGLIAIAYSVIALISYYLMREVYNYGLKLTTALLAFLPKLALPLSIRSRSDN